jgi:hypothetical protein
MSGTRINGNATSEPRSSLGQHVSNGGIHDPNNGLTFFSLGFAYHFGARP